MNAQLVAESLAARYGVRVRVGLHRWIEDVRDAETGAIIGQIVHEEGVRYTRDDGAPIPQSEIDRAMADVLAAYPTGDRPRPQIVPGAAFLARVTDAEYAATIRAAQSNPQIARWIEMLRMRGEIDLSSPAAQAGRTGLVAAGIFTEARAAEVFAP